MKLSLSSCALNPYLEAGTPRKEALQALRNSGFTCTDYDVTMDMLGDDYEQCAKHTARMLAELDLTAPQAHAPGYNPLLPPEDIDLTALFSRALRFCKIAGIPHIVVHPGAYKGITREEFFAKNIAFYKTLIPAVEETGVGVLIENIGNYADPHCLWTGKDLLHMLEGVDHPLFTACWDVGHANHFWPEDATQYDSILALGDKLTALHVHDNVGDIADPRDHYRIDMHSVPYFSVHSPLSFDEVLQALKDIGYKGTFNFETLFPGKKKSTFLYMGEEVKKLQYVPLHVWQLYNTALYETGKFMLETYDLFEG